MASREEEHRRKFEESIKKIDDEIEERRAAERERRVEEIKILNEEIQQETKKLKILIEGNEPQTLNSNVWNELKQITDIARFLEGCDKGNCKKRICFYRKNNQNIVPLGRLINATFIDRLNEYALIFEIINYKDVVRGIDIDTNFDQILVHIQRNELTARIRYIDEDDSKLMETVMKKMLGTDLPTILGQINRLIPGKGGKRVKKTTTSKRNRRKGKRTKKNRIFQRKRS